MTQRIHKPARPLLPTNGSVPPAAEPQRAGYLVIHEDGYVDLVRITEDMLDTYIDVLLQVTSQLSAIRRETKNKPVAIPEPATPEPL